MLFFETSAPMHENIAGESAEVTSTSSGPFEDAWRDAMMMVAAIWETQRMVGGEICPRQYLKVFLRPGNPSSQVHKDYYGRLRREAVTETNEVAVAAKTTALRTARIRPWIVLTEEVRKAAVKEYVDLHMSPYVYIYMQRLQTCGNMRRPILCRAWRTGFG